MALILPPLCFLLSSATSKLDLMLAPVVFLGDRSLITGSGLGGDGWGLYKTGMGWGVHVVPLQKGGYTTF